VLNPWWLGDHPILRNPHSKRYRLNSYKVWTSKLQDAVSPRTVAIPEATDMWYQNPMVFSGIHGGTVQRSSFFEV